MMQDSNQNSKHSKNDSHNAQESGGLLEEALARSGASREEIGDISTVDRAQDGANSRRKLPGVIQEAFLSPHLSLRLFKMSVRSRLVKVEVSAIRERCRSVILRFGAEGKLFNADGALNPELERELTRAGFYSLTIPEEDGGAGASMFEVASAMLETGRLGDPVIPGTLSIKTLIGPVGALKHYGTREQKEKLLSSMATDYFQGFFAATEPGAGCNVTKIRTHGVVEDDHLRIYGEKVFISRATYGARGAVFLKINGEYKVVIVDLPDQDTKEFQLKRYKLRVLQPAMENNGLIFKGLKVPLANVLPGNGLEAIFKDLDDGRWAVGVSATILATRVLAGSPRWIGSRETFGKLLKENLGIQYRVSMVAALMAGAELISLRTADSIDEGRSGELMAMIAKTWSTDALRDIMTKHGVEIHGGRSFVEGHKVGDNILNALVSTVYEGPNPMLAQAGVNALAKALRKGAGLEDLDRALKPAGVKLLDIMPDLKRPLSGLSQVAGVLWRHKRGLFKQRREIIPPLRTLLAFLFHSWKGVKHGKVIDLPLQGIPDERFSKHLDFAARRWFKWRWNFLLLVFKYGEKLATEQLVTEFEVYGQLSDIVVMLVAISAACEAAKDNDDGLVASLNMLCEYLTCRLEGKLPAGKGIKSAAQETSRLLIEGKIRSVEGVDGEARLDPFFDHNKHAI